MLPAADGCRDASAAQYDRRVASEYKHAVIRPARPEDVEAIAALHLASWRTAYRGFLPDEFLSGITLESRIVRWRQALDPLTSPLTETTVADAGGTVLGVCSFGPRRQPASATVAEVYALHVRPDVTRRGLGNALLDDALRRLAARGCSTSVLWVLRDNANARRFYEAQGWAFTGEEVVEDRSGYAIPETRYAITIDG
jgi:ribosomal protein S18 acetylase RimI-like enzyme